MKNLKWTYVLKIIIVSLPIIFSIIGIKNIYASRKIANDSPQTLVQEFIGSIKNRDFGTFLKSIYKGEEEVKDNNDYWNKKFKTACYNFEIEAKEIYGDDCFENLHYYFSINTNEITVLSKESILIKMPIIKVNEKYYLNIKITDFIQ